ncbi:MAG: type II toxin-antitoxin system death-on-curing family toxin [Candidatus Omnitrophota bacterium]
MSPTENSPPEMIQYLSVEQILIAHTELIKRYGGSEGVRDRGLLESAVFRPQASAFGKDAYVTLFEKCAVLGYSLIQNHSFVDGNKRIGFAAIHLMLLINGYDLTSITKEETAMAENIASGKMRETGIVQWLKQCSKKSLRKSKDKR